MLQTYMITPFDVGFTHRNFLGALRAPFTHPIREKDVGVRFMLIRGELTCLSEIRK